MPPFQNIPAHIAIIMDGNGRWAKSRHLPRAAGHNEGAKAVERTIEAAAKHGVKYLTFYAFSTENWTRPPDEIAALMNLLNKTLDRYISAADKKNVRLLVSGERKKLPQEIINKIDKVVKETACKTGLTVNLALNYGARQEIVSAVNNLLAQGKTAVSMQDIQANLYQPQLPDPDLIIRTSGEQRLSNFLLWQAAYSEFYFTPALWPDFNEEELLKALTAYQKRERRFGGI